MTAYIAQSKIQMNRSLKKYTSCKLNRNSTPCPLPDASETLTFYDFTDFIIRGFFFFLLVPFLFSTCDLSISEFRRLAVSMYFRNDSIVSQK